jgi:hypothetical protein
LRKEHVAPLIDGSTAAVAIASKLVAKIRQPRASAVSLDQTRHALAAVAIASAAPDFEKTNGAV